MRYATLLALLLSGLVKAQSPTPVPPVISGDGPPAPPLTATASTGSWKPPSPTNGLPPASMNGTGRQLYLDSADNFCLLMPPDPTTQNLVDAEAVAVSYCMKPGNDTRPFPDGFLKTAHFRKTNDYVQISGTFDPAVMNFSPYDCGGEYDNHGAEGVGNPVGAAVDGAANFFQFIGSCDLNILGTGSFCLRACNPGSNSYPLCNNQYDLMGCLFVAPGDYDTPGFTNCDADSGLPVGVYNDTYTFKQGDPVTPTVPVAAPSSSNCQTVSSPSASGVTYTWNQAVAVAQPTKSNNGNSNSNSNSNPNSNSGSNNDSSGAVIQQFGLWTAFFSGFSLLIAGITLL